MRAFRVGSQAQTNWVELRLLFRSGAANHATAIERESMRMAEMEFRIPRDSQSPCPFAFSEGDRSLLPLRIFAAHVGNQDANNDVRNEHPETQPPGSEFGLRDIDHGVVKPGVVHGLNEA